MSATVNALELRTWAVLLRMEADQAVSLERWHRRNGENGAAASCSEEADRKRRMADYIQARADESAVAAVTHRGRRERGGDLCTRCGLPVDHAEPHLTCDACSGGAA